jgi:quercetin dioxygenase-like cupin family protein
MEAEMSESTGHAYLESHKITGDVLHLDVEAESAAVLKAAKAAGVGHAGKTLIKDGPLRLVILGLKAGSTVREHEAAGPTSLHALSGQVKVASQARTDSLKAGDALVFGSSVPHSLEALEDSVVLVTIAWPTPPSFSARQESAN